MTEAVAQLGGVNDLMLGFRFREMPGKGEYICERGSISIKFCQFNSITKYRYFVYVCEFLDKKYCMRR